MEIEVLKINMFVTSNKDEDKDEDGLCAFDFFGKAIKLCVSSFAVIFLLFLFFQINFVVCWFVFA